jgi:hypothetical protein
MSSGRFLRCGLICALVIAAVAVAATPRARAADEVVSDCGDTGGPNQLRAKLAAIQSSGGGTLTFSCGPGPQFVILQDGVLPAITTATTIDGGGRTTISGNNATRILTVSAGASLTLNNLTISNAYWAFGDGGAISSLGTLVINNCTFTDNRTTAVAAGGAILALGRVTITNTLFARNEAGNGGAVYPRFSNAVVTISGSTFRDNQAVAPNGGGSVRDGMGGALLLWDGATATISSSTFSNNRASLGGAVFVFSNSKLNLTGSTVISNTAVRAGGALKIMAGAEVVVQDSTVSANTVTNILFGPLTTGGGAGLNNEGKLALVNVSLQDNSVLVTANTVGGGIANHGGSLTIDGGSVRRNQGYIGGGIYSTGTLTVTGATVSNNQSQFVGGGISTYGTATITGTTLDGNRANSYGGGLTNNGALALSDSTISNNQVERTSDISGGGLFQSSGTMTLANVTISGNRAPLGGGIGMFGGEATLNHVTLSGNSATNGGQIGLQASGDVAGRVLLRNTLLAGGASGANCYRSHTSEVIRSQGFNLSSDASCAFALTLPGDQNQVDPLLGPLADNGGPTRTHLPGRDSPAIDRAGGAGALAADQRGIARPQGAAADVGAVEVELAPQPSPQPTPQPAPQRVYLPLLSN